MRISSSRGIERERTEGPSDGSANLNGMDRRVLPVALVVAAALSDLAGAHGAAFLVLLVAVPTTAATALDQLGESVDPRGAVRGARLQASFSGLATLLLLAAA